MELHTALRLLDLPKNPPLRAVQAAYRRLVMRYHPDRNPQRPEWAHTMTTRVREAYRVACKHAETGTQKAEQPIATVATTTSRRAAPRSAFAETEQNHAAEMNRRRELAARIHHCESLLHDALHYYYAHRLDNAHLRSDGSQHLRYRRAVRALSRAAQACANLQEGPSTRALAVRAHDLKRVAKLVCYCAKRAAPGIPNVGGRAYSAYRHLTKGIEHLDGAICAALFPDLKIDRSPWTPGGRLSMSFHELMLVFTTYRISPWLEEAAARLELLDAFAAYTANRWG